MTLGSDFHAGVDLDPALSVVDGNTALADCILRRLSTDHGSLNDDPDYGYNIEALIGASGIDPDLVASSVLDQCYLEEEVQDATVDVDFIDVTMRITIRIVSGAGPFTLTISVNDLISSDIIPG